MEIGFLSEVVRHLLERPFNGILNVAMGVSMTMPDWITTLGRIMGVPASPESDGSRRQANDFVFDTAYLHSLFPDLSVPSPEECLKDYVNFHAGERQTATRKTAGEFGGRDSS